MTGDGELQEGPIWEAVMYSAHQRLDNLCVLVDNNIGQLDIVDRLIFPLPDLEAVFRAFGWRVAGVDATEYDAVFAALEGFKYGERKAGPRPSSAGPPRASVDSRVPERAQGHHRRPYNGEGVGASVGAAPEPGRRLRRLFDRLGRHPQGKHF